MIANMIVKLASNFDPHSTIYLVGSHAYGKATSGSDIDFLIISNDKAGMSKVLKRKLKHLLSKKLDCKIVTRSEIGKLSYQNYTYVYTMISFGVLKFGTPYKMGYSANRVSQEIRAIEDQFTIIRSRIEDKENYNILAIDLFNLAKRVRHFNRMIIPESKITLKEILGKHLLFLGRIYESITEIGISTSFNRQIRTKQPRKTDYNLLVTILNIIKDKFNQCDLSPYID